VKAPTILATLILLASPGRALAPAGWIDQYYRSKANPYELIDRSEPEKYICLYGKDSGGLAKYYVYVYQVRVSQKGRKPTIVDGYRIDTGLHYLYLKVEKGEVTNGWDFWHYSQVLEQLQIYGAIPIQ
jgi:hypothetical protein